ncbi:AIR synthase-related protein [Dethiosulfovibrio salsuginis]|uniref:AIR synthase-related protein n=1 Tax=Dethiosulfovibrio salsuginis TaxID=561720 RepID=UPI002E12FCDB
MSLENRVQLGKLPPAELESQILRYRGAIRPEVLVGPGIGEDAAIIEWPDGKLLTVSSDPIVGAKEGAGRYLVHVNANDIACKGGDPAYMVVTLIVPLSMGKGFAERTMAEIDQECRKIGVAVVGGHTEITDRYENPVVMGTMIGTTQYRYRSESLAPGDVLLATKHIGLEGMAILAHDRPDLLQSASKEELEAMCRWLEDISVLPEATAIRHLSKFMHDPTEGGFLGGLSELSRLGRIGVEVDFSSLPLDPMTVRFSRELGFDPLKLISSGVLLAVVREAEVEEALTVLAQGGIDGSVVGRIVEGPGNLEVSTEEELWRLLDMPRREIL